MDTSSFNDNIAKYKDERGDLEFSVKKTRTAYTRGVLEDAIIDSEFCDDTVEVEVYVGDEYCPITIKCQGYEQGWDLKWEDMKLLSNEGDTDTIMDVVEFILGEAMKEGVTVEEIIPIVKEKYDVYS